MMNIRQARNRDLPALSQIERMGMELYYRAGFSRDEFLPRTEEDLQFLLDQTILVVAADAADQPIGYICYYPIEAYLHLEEHAVHPAWHGRGVGKALLAYFLEAGREMRGCEHYSLFCYREADWASRCYQKHGFAFVEPWRAGHLETNLFQRILDFEAKQQYRQHRVLMLRD